MPIKAQSADGTIHEFPDGTSGAVIDRAMREYAMESKTQKADIMPEPPQDESFGGWLADQGSFLGKRALNAAASLPGLPMDMVSLAARNIPAAATNQMGAFGALANLERGRQAVEGADSMVPLGGENIRAAIKDYSGGTLTPRAPRNRAEEYGGAVADFLGASAIPGGFVASASKAPLRVVAGETLASLGGGIGQEAARDLAPDNPYAPMIGGAVGSFGPSALASVGRGFVRGGRQGAKQAQDALDDFARIGETPTLSQATTGGYWPGRYMARLLELSPGGVLPSQHKWKLQLESAAKRIDDAINRSTGGLGVSEEAAGAALQSGARRFADKISRTQAGLERRLEAAVPSGTLVNPSNTLQTLADMTSIRNVPGSSARTSVGAATVSPTIERAMRDFQSDVQKNGGVTFQALKAFRTQLGAKTQSGQSLIGDVSSGQASQLYKALTKDMEAAATANGAKDLVRLRNDYYSSRKGQLEDVFDPKITRQTTPEATYRAVRNADRSQLEQIMGQMSPRERRVVAGQVLHEIGLPPPSAATGDTRTFSLDSFDTNFEKLNRKGTLDAMLDKSGTSDLKAALQDVSKVAESFKGAEKFMRNPSQSAYVGIHAAAGGSLATAAWASPQSALFTALAFYGVPYALVRGGNSPAFIRLIADTGRQTAETLPGHIARMSRFVEQHPEYATVLKQALERATSGESAENPEQP